MDLTDADYEMLDLGDGARLERFGERLVVRPYPGAADPPGDPVAWRTPSMTFDAGRGWSGDTTPWQVGLGGLTVELRATATGQVGLFPEQAVSWSWLRERVQPGSEVLNLFAYTGVATLLAAQAGASVVHVDGSRPTVAWARRNAELSGLAERPVRWIVDDVAAFAGRELRRGRRYDGIVLDPPSYGHGYGGRAWRLERDLAPLLDTCAALTGDTAGFILLTAHTPRFDGDRLAEVLSSAIGARSSEIDRGPLRLTARTGRQLDLGSFARWPGTR